MSDLATLDERPTFPLCDQCGKPCTVGQPGRHFGCMATCPECLHPFEGPRHRHSDYGDVKRARLADEAARRGVPMDELEADSDGSTLLALLAEAEEVG